MLVSLLVFVVLVLVVFVLVVAFFLVSSSVPSATSHSEMTKGPSSVMVSTVLILRA